MSNRITVTATINEDAKKVWDFYMDPEHITKWNFADPSWHCPMASNEIKVGGRYFARMEAKDGSFGFDFEAIYDEIEVGESFTYTFGDRKATVEFKCAGNQTEITIVFDAEKENPIEMQKGGWQAILNNFKNYVEQLKLEFKKVSFTIQINAGKEKVWEALWSEANYEKWTSVFGEGNKAISDWKEGSKIQFVAKDGAGLFSIIEKKATNEHIVFKHLGEMKNGEEIANEWAGAKEKYFLSEINGITTIDVEIDTKEEYTDYFNGAFPKALQIVKQISETN